MNAADFARRLHQHRSWVNGLLIDAASKLSPEQLRQPFPIGQGSLWKTLLHLYAAEYVWLDALNGLEQSIAPGDVAGKLPGNQEGPGAIVLLEQLKKAWSELNGRWQAYLDSLTPEQLDDVVYKVRSLGGRFSFRRSDVLIHVCTHGQYTAAQAINMLRRLGADALPDPMLITMARSETQAG